MLSTKKQLSRGLTLGTRYAWGQSGRDSSGWIAAVLSLESAVIGHSFIGSGFMDLEGSLELIWSVSSLIGGRIPPAAMQSASHLSLHTPSDRKLTTSLRSLFYCGTGSVLGMSAHAINPNL